MVLLALLWAIGAVGPSDETVIVCEVIPLDVEAIVLVARGVSSRGRLTRSEWLFPLGRVSFGRFSSITSWITQKMPRLCINADDIATIATLTTSTSMLFTRTWVHPTS